MLRPLTGCYSFLGRNRQIPQSHHTPAKLLFPPVSQLLNQSPQSNTQSATESGTLSTLESSILYATKEEASLAVAGLSKGQQRVLRFLLSNRDASNHSHTIPIGY